MRRARLQRELLVLAGVVGALVVLAVVSFRGASGASTAAPSSARPTALAFARAYVAYLDGRVTVGQVIPVTSQVAALVRGGGAIAPRDRDGVLTLRRLNFSGVRGAPSAKASLDAGDRRHTLQAVFSLTYLGGRWRVAYLVPPDLSTILAPPAPRTQASSAARSAAARFALAYAGYREGSTRRLPAGMPYIRQQIAGGKDPLAAIQATRSQPRLVSLDALPQGPLTSVAAVIAAGGQRHSFSFVLERAAGRWQAWQFPVSGP